jgi:hypothetical protein
MLRRLGLDKKQISEHRLAAYAPKGLSPLAPFGAKFPDVILGKRAELAANTTR